MGSHKEGVQRVKRAKAPDPESDRQGIDPITTILKQCTQVQIADLRVAIDVHRTNCHQPDCPVLAAMEQCARARESSL